MNITINIDKVEIDVSDFHADNVFSHSVGNNEDCCPCDCEIEDGIEIDEDNEDKSTDEEEKG